VIRTLFARLCTEDLFARFAASASPSCSACSAINMSVNLHLHFPRQGHDCRSFSYGGSSISRWPTASA